MCQWPSERLEGWNNLQERYRKSYAEPYWIGETLSSRLSRVFSLENGGWLSHNQRGHHASGASAISQILPRASSASACSEDAVRFVACRARGQLLSKTRAALSQAPSGVPLQVQNHSRNKRPD